MKRARPSKKERLPPFISPMLAKAGTAFDSAAYVYEVKWDGTRALAFIENDRCKLLNRRKADMTERYPEFASLQEFPNGTVLDGEIVAFNSEGKPDFSLLMSREQTRSPLKIRLLSRSTPATYMVFDLLYWKHQSLLREPFHKRRKKLELLLRSHQQKNVIVSDTMPGEHGKAFFAEVSHRELEGVIAKRLNSLYLPGQRSDDWIKVKRSAIAECAIIGFEPSDKRDFRSLIIAMPRDGELVCVGKVGTGFNARLRKKLNDLLWNSIRPQPWVLCKIAGNWVEPGLFCRVKYLELTVNGEFRGPAFIELIEGS